MERDDYQGEIRAALRREPFFQTGVNRLIKVLPIDGAVPDLVRGYVTQEKFLLNKTPRFIETALGLPLGYLKDGCRVLAPLYPPGPSQVVYELTTNYPDGLAFGPISDQRFPPGTVRHIHQWRLTTDVRAKLLVELLPDQPYTMQP